MLYMLKFTALGLPFLWKKRKARKTIIKNERDPNLFSVDNLRKQAYKTLRFIFLGLDIKIYYNGLKNIPQRACVFYPNHVNKFDSGFLYYIIYKNYNREISFIAKKELEYSSMRHLFHLTDVLFLDRSNLRQSLELYETAKKKLTKDKISFCLFPEGTRSNPNELLPFKPGAFKLCYDAHCPIVPVSIFNSDCLGTHWRMKKARIYVYFHPPIEPKDFLTSDTVAISNKVQNIIQASYDNKEKYIAEILEEHKKMKKPSKNNL